jgi:hypothetical protein
VETLGRLGAPAMRYPTAVGTRAAADGDGSSRQPFVSGVLREVSVTLCRWIERPNAGCFALAAGQALMPGMARPTAEVGAEGA